MGSDSSRRARHPGYRSLIGPTHDWRPRAPDAFHWVVYGPRDAEGMADRRDGYAPSRRNAERAVADMVDAWYQGRANAA